MNKLLQNSIILLVIVLGGFACTDEYLTDTGVAEARTELTVCDYLEQNRYGMFDSLVVLIDHLDLRDSINTCGTFFAPNDYNIQLYLDERTQTLRSYSGVEDTTYTFNNMLTDLQSRAILQYALNERVTMEATTINGEEYSTLSDQTMTVLKIQTTDDAYYVRSDIPVYFMYLLRDGKNEERCQTTDILTENGNGPVLHVLNNEHIFSLFSNETIE